MKSSDRLNAALAAIWLYAKQVPQLTYYLDDHKDTAIKLVRELAEVNQGRTFAEWKEAARKELLRLGVRGETEWQEILLNLGYETIKGEAARPWWKKVFGWVSKVKEFLVRNGLNTFVEGYTRQVIGYLTDEIKNNPDVTFRGLKESAFAFIKSISPNSSDTWVTLVLNLGLSVLKARTGIVLPL